MPDAASYRDRVRTEALSVARSIIAKEGLAALQARRVARDANCSVGSLYNVFGDIDGVVIAVNVETLSELGKVLATNVARSRGETTEKRLTGLALAYMRFALGHLPSWKAIFEHRLPAHVDVPPGYRADQARLLALIGEIIAADISDSGLRTTAARALFASVHGIIALSVDNKLSDFEEHALEREIRFIVTAAANGLKSVR